MLLFFLFYFFFFFQAEDGIRDGTVTGVQTCALPIWPDRKNSGRPTDSSMALMWCDTAGCDSRSASAARATPPVRDRKSTRLNSSHSSISYAVFCLKKKKKKKIQQNTEVEERKQRGCA